jgi:catechol 2,3-dioxygenase
MPDARNPHRDGAAAFGRFADRPYGRAEAERVEELQPAHDFPGYPGGRLPSLTPVSRAEPTGEIFDTVVGAVTLRVGDAGRQRDFYERAIGLSAGGDGDGELRDAEGRVLVRLDDSSSRGSEQLLVPHTGLFHTAFRYADRAALGAAVARAVEGHAVFQGASDHGVSEAVYFADAEGNGIELYRDRPYDEWPLAEGGRVGMFTHPLDVQALMADAAERPVVAACDVGHIHLMTADVERSNAFWRDVVGLDERQRFGPSATFLAEGLYHHHLGANSWHSAGAPPAPIESPGLDAFELRLRSQDAVDAAADRLEAAGHPVDRTDGSVSFHDPDTNRVVLSAR